MSLSTNPDLNAPHLADASGARARYRDLARRTLPNLPDDTFDRLPPFLCASLNGSADRLLPGGVGWDRPNLMVGASEAAILQIGTAERPMALCVGGVAASLLDELELSDTPLGAPSDDNLQLLQHAVRTLPELSSRAAETVGGFTSVIVWLKLRKQGESRLAGQPFASCTFGQLPGATFLTALATRSIPPATTFPIADSYPLQEALYHEALHQQLTETQRVVSHFHDQKVADSAQVEIPWRSQRWSLPHSLHSFFVYAHLAKLRASVANGATDQARALLMSDAAEAAIAAAGALELGIRTLDALLTHEGKALIAHLGDSLATTKETQT